MKKYLQIYHDLLNDIHTKKYQKDDLLPSDAQLVMKYNVSRETVRKAVKLLFDEGYIQTIRGKGSIVLNADRFTFPLSTIESYKELVTRNHMQSTNIVLVDRPHVEVPKNLLLDSPQIQAQMIIRKRVVEETPLVVDYDYVNEDVVGHVPVEDAQRSLFSYFEDELGLKISYATKRFTIEPADYDDIAYLQIDKKIPIFVVRSETCLSDNRVLSYTESRHRADKFRGVEFARRSK